MVSTYDGKWSAKDKWLFLAVRRNRPRDLTIYFFKFPVISRAWLFFLYHVTEVVAMQIAPFCCRAAIDVARVICNTLICFSDQLKKITRINTFILPYVQYMTISLIWWKNKGSMNEETEKKYSSKGNFFLSCSHTFYSAQDNDCSSKERLKW